MAFKERYIDFFSFGIGYSTEYEYFPNSPKSIVWNSNFPTKRWIYFRTWRKSRIVCLLTQVRFGFLLVLQGFNNNQCNSYYLYSRYLYLWVLCSLGLCFICNPNLRISHKSLQELCSTIYWKLWSFLSCVNLFPLQFPLNCPICFLFCFLFFTFVSDCNFCAV